MSCLKNQHRERALVMVGCTALPGEYSLHLLVLQLCLVSLGVFWINEDHDPGFLHHQALTLFPHGQRGEAGTQMESTLSRRFGNYTLETNQPEHCFLISRTKQRCMDWRTLEVTRSPSGIPPYGGFHPLRPAFISLIRPTWLPAITDASQQEERVTVCKAHEEGPTGRGRVTL